MPKDVLDEREFELINIIGAHLGSNQRDLSLQMDLSLGQTNMLIRRLISKGFIRITQLNKKKAKYLLTPKGIMEKMRKSVKYTLNTINSISLIKERIKKIVLKFYEEGERIFIIFGKSDFAMLIEMVLKENGISDCHITYIDKPPSQKMNGVLMICKENIKPVPEAQQTINLIEALAQDDVFMNHVGNSREVQCGFAQK